MSVLIRDCVCSILKFLNLADVSSVRLVCKKWKMVCDSDLFWSQWAQQTVGMSGFNPDRHKSWKSMLRQWNLPQLQMAHSQGHHIHGRWRRVVLAGPQYSVNGDVLGLVKAQCGSLAEVRTSTASVGIVLLSREAHVLARVHELVTSKVGIDVGPSRNIMNDVLLEESLPSIHCFDIVPHVNVCHHFMFLCVDCGDYATHPNAAAKFVELLFHCCSTVIFAAHNHQEMLSWALAVGAHFSPPPPCPFSTHENTPDVVFAGNEPLRMKEVFGKADWAFTSHILQRSSNISEELLTSIHHLSTKVLRVPAWVAAECTAPVPAAAVLQLLLSSAKASTCRNHGFDLEVMSIMADSMLRAATAFYENALLHEFHDVSQPQIYNSAVSTLSTPLEPSHIVSLHNQFFFTALRSFSLQLCAVCGRDTDSGLRLMEKLKQDISSIFRTIWRKNQAMSKEYCEAIFLSVFNSVEDKFIVGEGFNEKRGLKRWYNAMMDKISEYRLKAIGTRRDDVLSEQILNRVVPQLRTFCLTHPDHKYLKLSDCELAIEELRRECLQLASDYHLEHDRDLNLMQRDSAVYTAYVGTEWIANSYSIAASTLRRIALDAEQWEAALEMKLDELRSPSERGGHNSDSGYTSAEDTVVEPPVAFTTQVQRFDTIQSLNQAEHQLRLRAEEQAKRVSMQASMDFAVVPRWCPPSISAAPLRLVKSFHRRFTKKN